MTQRLVLPSATGPRAPRATRPSRLGDVAAYAAAPLWALQSLIWVAAPKVQEQSEPFHITSVVLFVLVWSSIAGAVALSAAAAARITRKVNAPPSRASRGATVLAASSLTMATIGTICILLAPLPTVQEVAISAMTNMLNGATVLLAASLCVSAFICSRLESVSLRTTACATSLAAGTIAIIVAIVASGTQSVVGLYFAVAVAALNAVAWFLWARMPWTAGRRRSPA
jgi:hypothetical protein